MCVCLLYCCIVCCSYFWLFFTFVASFPSVLCYCWLDLLTCKTVCHITYTVLVETLKQQTSENHEVLIDCLRDRCNSNKTEIVWILQFCFIKVLTVGFSRNELPIFIIVLPIPISMLILKKYCNTLAILKAVLAIPANSNKILQY